MEPVRLLHPESEKILIDIKMHDFACVKEMINHDKILFQNLKTKDYSD